MEIPLTWVGGLGGTFLVLTHTVPNGPGDWRLYLSKSHESNNNSITHRIHGAGIWMLTWLGYIDDKCYIATIYSSTMDPSWVKKKLLTSRISHRPKTPSPVRLSGHGAGVVSWGQLLPWRFHQCVPRPRTPTSHRPSSSTRLVAAGDCWHGRGWKPAPLGQMISNHKHFGCG